MTIFIHLKLERYTDTVKSFFYNNKLCKYNISNFLTILIKLGLAIIDINRKSAREKSELLRLGLWSKQKQGTAEQTQNMCITFIQRRPNVFDVGRTLHKCYANDLRLLGITGNLLCLILIFRFGVHIECRSTGGGCCDWRGDYAAVYDDYLWHDQIWSAGYTEPQCRPNNGELTMLPCKVKRQYLLTCKVSRYCLLSLQICIVLRRIFTPGN